MTKTKRGTKAPQDASKDPNGQQKVSTLKAIADRARSYLAGP